MLSSPSDSLLIEEKPRKKWPIIMIIVIIILLIMTLIIILLLPDNVYEILLISDIRIDKRYDPDGTVESKCQNRSNYPLSTREFGRYGCDSPLSLYKSCIDSALSASSRPSAVIINGGILSDPDSLDEIKDEAKSIIASIQEYYGTMPVLLSLGSTEFLPKYGSSDSDKATFNNLAVVVEKGIYKTDLSSFWNGGYYSFDLKEANLRILMINSMPYIQHRYSANLGDDPYGQFEWIKNQIRISEQQNMKVGLVYHTPFKFESDDQWNDQFSYKFSEAIQSEAISFITTASTFFDEFLPLANTSFYSLSSPSVSPGKNGNPGFRILKIAKGQLKDVIQYSGNIFGKIPTWNKEYSFKSTFGLDDLSGDKISKSILNNKESFLAYMNRRTVQSQPEFSTFRCMLAAPNKTGVAACLDNSL